MDEGGCRARGRGRSNGGESQSPAGTGRPQVRAHGLLNAHLGSSAVLREGTSVGGPDLVPGCHPNSKACPLLLLTTTPLQPQPQLQPLRPPEPQWSWGSFPKLVLNSSG